MDGYDLLFGSVLLKIIHKDVLRDRVLLLLTIFKFLLEGVERLYGLARVELESQQLLVSIVDVLHMLLVFNLQLMEVNELKVIAHFLFVFDLILSLHDLGLERLVFQGQLLNQRVFRLLFVFKIFDKLFSIVFASSSVLSSGEESTEVEGLFTDLGNGQIRAFKNGLQTLQQSL